MKKRLIIITFSSPGSYSRFAREVSQRRRVLIPLQSPLPKNTAVVLHPVFPGEKPPPPLHGAVSVRHGSSSEIVFNGAAEAVGVDIGTPFPAGPAPAEKAADGKGGATQKFEWLREIVSHGEYRPAEEEAPKRFEEPLSEKKTLTTQEQERVAPIGTFIMNLTKAILRTGYYDPGHPGAKTARRGLYEEFQKVLAHSTELMLTKEESRDHEDFSITGVLDSPVAIRTIVGKGVAALFVPKLFEYFEKKNLLSIAIKKQISEAHFDAFIAVMSNPEVDRASDKNAGRILTNELVKHNITEISTVFANDQLNFEKNLPWRVAMAMHRLAKDLNLLPMFKGINPDVIRKMKQQSVQDIIRPLAHPQLLNDFLVNCYIIAEHVVNMEPREIEQIIVDAFPAQMLLPASQYTFSELDWLKKKAAEETDNERIFQRLEGIKRILKMIAGRIVVENIAGGQHFLAFLYENDILSFEELPADAQYVIHSRQMADDVRINMDDYQAGLLNVQTGEDLMIYADCFRRIAPLLMESKDWGILRRIAAAVRSASNETRNNESTGLKLREADSTDNATGVGAGSADTGQRLFGYIFGEQAGALVRAYESGDAETRKQLNDLFNELGYFGIRILGQILCESKDRNLRGQVTDVLMQRPLETRHWVTGVLNHSKHPWFVYRNAILILREVSTDPADGGLVRVFLEHEHPRLRLEALSTIVHLRPADVEELIIDRIMDSDERVNWRAVKAIAELPKISTSGMNTILSMITAGMTEQSDAADDHVKHVARLITAIQGLRHIPNPGRVEGEILKFAGGIAVTDKKWSRLLKRSRDTGDDVLALKAAVPLLGRIGRSFSGEFLRRLARSYPELSDAAKQAIQSIQNRETVGQ